MLTKKAIFMLLIVLSMGTLIHAQSKGTIVFTTRPNFIDPKTGESPDMWHIYALEDAGYEVIQFYNASLSTAEQATLDTLYNANLIVMGRSTPSLDYGNNKEAWNSIPTPTLCLGMWAVRNNRLNWFNTENVVTNTEQGTVYNAIIDVPDDPVFEGLDTSAPVPWIISPYDVMGVTYAGNGTVLARMESDFTVLFVRWEPDEEFYPGSVDYPAGHRTLIGNGRDNAGQPPFDYYNFTEESELVFLAEVARMVALGGWKVPITISGNNMSFTRIFGGNTGATDGYDPGLDLPTAPPGMTYYTYFSIGGFPNYLKTDMRGWVSPYESNIDWTLKIINATGITSSLSWDSSKLPSEGKFTLKGAGINVDMRTQSSATINGDATLTIEYRYQITYTFPKQGWYLISLPVIPTDNSLNTLFPGAIAAYEYNSATSVYHSVTNLEPKKGYWLLIPAASTVTVSGTPITTFTEYYNSGWHLIGSVIGMNHPFADPDDIPNNSVIATYGWDVASTMYVKVYPAGTGILNEKEGYWLAIAQPCSLTIPGNPPLAKSIIDDIADKLAFQQQFGSQPPVPPFIADAGISNFLPVAYQLSQNYPNPFNPTTNIPFYLPEKSHVRLSLSNILGEEVTEIVDREYGAGQHEVVFNAGTLAAGIYFYKIETGRYTDVKKLALIK